MRSTAPLSTGMHIAIPSSGASGGGIGRVGHPASPSCREPHNLPDEPLRRGGYLISVNAADEQYERVLDILDDEGTIDIDERADSWRAEGWSGVSTEDVRSGSPKDLTTADRPASASEDVAAEAAEPSDVGRRDLSHGRARIRSYDVEDPSKRR